MMARIITGRSRLSGMVVAEKRRPRGSLLCFCYNNFIPATNSVAFPHLSAPELPPEVIGSAQEH
jgi:hypothetical protein